MQLRKLFGIFTPIFIISLILMGCGGEKKTQEGEEDVAVKKEWTTLPTDTLTKEYLASVPPELGGEGFTGEGWQSNEDYESIADPKGVVGGQITLRMLDFPSTLRYYGKDSNSWINNLIAGLIYESLISIHSNTLEIVPGVATHWKMMMDTTNKEKPQTFWFRINPKAKWADGSPMTAYDVVATWRLLMDPSMLFPSAILTYGQYFEPVAESPYIVRVSTKELNWRLFLYIGGMNLHPEKYIGHLSGYEFRQKYQFDMVPGSGLYDLKLENVDKGRSITLTRRNDWWDKDNPRNVGSANFDRIKYVVVADDRLAFEKFKKGEFDIFQIGRAQWWVEETDFDDVKRGLVQKRKIYNDEPQGTAGLVMNMRVSPFNDHRVRAAMAHLFNREELIEQLFYNEYQFLDSYYAGGIYENPNNPKYRYDPDKAVDLLTEAGWKNRNQEGWLVNEHGEVFELTLMIDQGMERIFTILQEDLAKVGIKLELKQSTGPTMFKMVMERKFKIHYQGWTGLMFPNPETSFASSMADSNNTNNLSGIKDERIDKLLKVYNITFEQAERVDIIREIDGILMEIQPYALGWYAPYSRILFWNKFGYPEAYYSRTSTWYGGVLAYWWVDPEKEKQLEEARKNPNIKLPVGKTNVTYWPDWNERHGRQYRSEF